MVYRQTNRQTTITPRAAHGRRGLISIIMYYRAYAVGGVDTPIRHLGGQLLPTGLYYLWFARTFSCNMVNFCAVVGCSNRANRESSKHFYRLPAILTNQGMETRVLSEKRWNVWLSRLRRADLKESQYSNVRICSDHFVKGKPSTLYAQDDPDWAPSLNLGYSGVTLKQSISAQDRHCRSLDRSRKKEMMKEQETECMEVESGKDEQLGVSTQSALETGVNLANSG